MQLNSVFNPVPMVVLTIVSAVGLVTHLSATEPAWSPLPAGSDVAVTLVNGRILRGQIDASSNDQWLRLSVEKEGIAVGSIIPARDILTVAIDTPVQLPDVPQGREQVSATPISQRRSNPNSGEGTVKSLTIAAELANWDSDPQPDGLRLIVLPRNSQGYVVPVSGSLSVQLKVFRGDPRNLKTRFLEEESWAFEVSQSDYAKFGAIIQLPFQRLNPESDRELLEVGTLHARLNVAGHGTLDASLNDVQLKTHAFTEEIRQRRK